MESSDLVLDLLMLDALVIAVVVGCYAGYLKVRSLFRGFRGLKTRRDMDRAIRWLGIDSYVHELSERRAAAMRRHSNVTLMRGGSEPQNRSSVISFWIPYLRRKGVAGALARRRLESRVRSLLARCPRRELDKIAFSLTCWRNRDCPDDELYIARPPHHISLLPRPHHFDEKKLKDRRIVAATLKAKDRKELAEDIAACLRGFSSRSLQWIADCIENGWVEQMSATRSRTIRFTMQSERSRPNVPA
ncbi:MAG: hypothetical protein HY914_19930 [Desulfomonile tiedjei]|nr:hypothetical protein [Desulfomonile tiedjei]